MTWSLAKSIHRAVHSVNSMMDLSFSGYSSCPEPSVTSLSSSTVHARTRTGVKLTAVCFLFRKHHYQVVTKQQIFYICRFF